MKYSIIYIEFVMTNYNMTFDLDLLAIFYKVKLNLPTVRSRHSKTSVFLLFKFHTEQAAIENVITIEERRSK